MGFDLPSLQAQKKLLVNHVDVERKEIEESGEYDLTGLFIRIENAVKAIGAKRVVLDTIETLFAVSPTGIFCERNSAGFSSG